MKSSRSLEIKNLNFLFIVSADNTVKNESMAWDVCCLTCRLQRLSFWTVKQSVLSSSPHEDSGSLEIMNFNFLVILSADNTVWKMRPWLENFWNTFYQNRSIDTSFDPPLFSLVSTFQYYLRKEFPKLRAFIFSHCRDLPYSLWNWGNGGKFRRPPLYSQFMVLWVQVYNGNCRSLSLLSPRFLQQNYIFYSFFILRAMTVVLCSTSGYCNVIKARNFFCLFPTNSSLCCNSA